MDIEKLAIWLVIPTFVAFWLLLSRALAQRGWNLRSKHYATCKAFPPPEMLIQFSSAAVGSASYGGVLTLGADHEGIYLVPMVLCRFGHAPLFIPWSDIVAREEKAGWRKMVRLRTNRAPDTQLLLIAKTYGRLEAKRARA